MNLAELKRLAEANRTTFPIRLFRGSGGTVASYIAAASPDVVLKLIAVADAAQELQIVLGYATAERCVIEDWPALPGNVLASALAVLSQPEDGNG